MIDFDKQLNQNIQIPVNEIQSTLTIPVENSYEANGNIQVTEGGLPFRFCCPVTDVTDKKATFPIGIHLPRD